MLDLFLFVAVQTFVYPFACLCLATLYISLDLFQLVLYLCSSKLWFSLYFWGAVTVGC